MKGLHVFAPLPLQETDDNRTANLRSPVIWKVVCCCLGPEGTNIEQAARLWVKRLKLTHKAEIVLRDTPEESLALARSITEKGVLAVFWTCAVYKNEHRLFFANPDVYPFYFQQEMALDEMQLACKPVDALQINIDVGLPVSWRVASHPSPATLVDGLAEVVLANSNAAAARDCASGKAELCITTESARKVYGLEKIHSFGSPSMIFFGGVTQHGQEQVESARADWLLEPCYFR